MDPGPKFPFGVGVNKTTRCLNKLKKSCGSKWKLSGSGCLPVINLDKIKKSKSQRKWMDIESKGILEQDPDAFTKNPDPTFRTHENSDPDLFHNIINR